MKILLLTEYYPSTRIANAGAFIHARSQLYHQTNHQVLILSTPQNGTIAQYAIDNIPVLRLSDLQIGLAMADAFSPDIVIIHFPYHNTFPTQLALTLRHKYPVVAWIHGYEAMYTAFQGYHRGLSRWLSIPYDWLKLYNLKQFLSKCAAVVYVSRSIKKLAEQSMGYKHPHSFVVANPVDTQLFSPQSTPKASGKLRGIALRSLAPVYGLDIAIRAYADIKTTQLSIIGTGKLEQPLRHLIDTTYSNSRLLAQGFPHKQVPALLRQYDYFVAPSRNETQGLAMCEAMSCGLPVVATRVGGIPEFVRHRIDGYLVPPENPDALRQAILKLVQDPTQCRQMGQNARQHIVEICDGRKIVTRELQILREALQRWQNVSC